MFLDFLPFGDRRTLVDTGALVGALIFAQLVRMDGAFRCLNNDLFGIDGDNFTVFISCQNLTGINSGILLHTG